MFGVSDLIVWILGDLKLVECDLSIYAWNKLTVIISRDFLCQWVERI